MTDDGLSLLQQFGIPIALLIATMTALACAGVMQLSVALTAQTSLSFGHFHAASQ